MAAPGPESARRRVISVFLIQGLAGLIVMLWLTWLRHDQTVGILRALGGDAPILIVIFIAFATTLALLKFELTDLVYVALVITAYMTMFPILGVVLSAWLAVFVSVGTRVFSLLQIGPASIARQDPVTDYVKAFGLFGTYGIPIVVASSVFESLGGAAPVMEATATNAFAIAAGGAALIVMNSLFMFWPQRAYGYSVEKIFSLYIIDGGISFIALPYATVTALSYGAMGWGAVVALAFTGCIANYIARKLALTRSKTNDLLQRLASLTNIGKTISLRYSTDELLMAIYTECKAAIDCTLFSIALHEESKNELAFELEIRDGVVAAKERIPIGEGLNSWVIQHHQPLLLGSTAEEKRFGLKHVIDAKPTESWLGVPMLARDRVMGVISVESYKKNAFTADDLILLTAIANQAAVAIENSNLYRDLEGLTYALEHRVMERTNEMREINLRLLAADRSKNQFLANMSHELRTPLNSIIGFSSVLIDATRGLMQPRLHRFLENIHAAGNHLLELINDILDLSKIEAGKMELRTDQFDLRETIAAVERVMKGVAAEAKVQILSQLDPALPPVQLDEGRLKQILFNLLSNAVKFSPPSSIVAIHCRFVPQDASPLGFDTVRIDVTDQGIGIPADELQRIFVEFYQTEDGRRARNTGTGLGLSLTRNFVELHYGKIEVTSKPGHGSTFTLYLPIDYTEAARAAVSPLHDVASQARV
ncbi:MAG TPA: GAF domain-containing sensor histidine kinase [Thermoanaerobaculia bacterium]|jgi:signal transduction histidine kinase|nr:GAF domain-containing sensor histidine kinase [Thermoanaerobaculia bacterium]